MPAVRVRIFNGGMNTAYMSLTAAHCASSRQLVALSQHSSRPRGSLEYLQLHLDSSSMVILT